MPTAQAKLVAIFKLVQVNKALSEPVHKCQTGGGYEINRDVAVAPA